MYTLVFPGGTNNNQYINNIIEDLSYNDNVCQGFTFSRYFKNSFRYRDKAVLLNWIENQTRQNGLLGIIYIIGFIFLSKLLRYKIYWIRHNYISHDLDDDQVKLNCMAIRLIELFSNRVYCHGYEFSKLKKYVYLPHPIYRGLRRKDFDIKDIDKRYIIFGRIKPYKKVIEVLTRFSDKRFIIAGKFDKNYKEEIEGVIRELKIDVIIIDEFIDDGILNILILKSKAVLISNDGSTSIVSGMVYHSLSLGANVVLDSNQSINQYDPMLIGINVFESGGDNFSLPDDICIALQRCNGKGAIRAAYYGQK